MKIKLHENSAKISNLIKSLKIKYPAPLRVYQIGGAWTEVNTFFDEIEHTYQIVNQGNL